MMRYLATMTHIGLYPEFEVTDYWVSYKDRGVQYYIYEFISLERQ